MRVLVVLGHPRDDSLSGALAEAYVHGAGDAGAEVRFVRVGELAFEPDVREPSPADQELEPDLAAFREHLRWAQHLVLVYPTWWGTFPARLKALLDRTLTPGFAFRYDEDGIYRALLNGRSAELITTMDTPRWVYRWIYRAPGHHALQQATLGFCGLRTVRKTVFGPVIRSSDEQRAGWLRQARSLGGRLRTGAIGPVRRRLDRAGTWLAALRLQFYPMSWIAYAVGALAVPGTLDPVIFWAGLFALFLLEAATVFSNEWLDYESDRRNRHSGPFNGGSRVLVEARVERPHLQWAAGLALGGFAVLAIGLSVARGGPAAVWLALLGVLAIGYTAPPLQLSYRSLGELDVAFTHSTGVLMAGYLLQGGAWGDPLPWLLSLPLLLSVLPAITLSGIPDLPADSAAGKRTLAVRFGQRRAVDIAVLAAAAAAAVAVTWWATGLVEGLYGPAILLAAGHGAWLLWRLRRYRQSLPPPGRIDGLMVIALSYILWFCVLPWVRLL